MREMVGRKVPRGVKWRRKVWATIGHVGHVATISPILSRGVSSIGAYYDLLLSMPWFATSISTSHPIMCSWGDLSTM